MPDPVWSSQYNYGSTPEQNNFTRVQYQTPVLTLQQTGPGANRRVELNTNGGSMVFVASSVPNILENVGATAEMICSTNGAGDVGFELRLLQHVFGIRVYVDRIFVDVPGAITEHLTASNAADVTIRITYGAGTMSLYRNGVLVVTRAIPQVINASQSFMFWGEEGGTQIFRAMKLYLGGPVAPG